MRDDVPDLTFTGERYLPSEAGVIAYEHWHRYAVAQRWVRGLRVLDVACGEGYGAALLAKHATETVGVDNAADAVAHAARAYAATPRLRFEAAALPALPFEAASFDVVVSFETLEHVPDAAQAMAELRRVLRPDGLLIASTPDRDIYSGAQGVRNLFHTREMSRPEFQALCGAHFSHVAIVGQKIYVASVIGPERPGARDAIGCFRLDDGGPAPALAGVLRPTYLLAFCSDAPLPDGTDAPSLLLDNDATQDERETVLGWAQTMKRERDAAVEALHEAGAEIDAAAVGTDRVRHERDVLAEEIMDLAHALRGMLHEQRQEGDAARSQIEALWRASDAGARHMAALDLAVTQAAPEMREFIAAEVSGVRRDVAERIGSLERLRSRDLETIRAALDQDRVALEAVLQMEAGLERREAAWAQADARGAALQHRVDALLASTSWKVTGPLRALMRVFKRV